MKYISKGMVIRASTEDLLFVTRCGVDFQLTGEQAALWLNGRFGFAKNRENVPEVKALQQLKRQGLVEITEGDEPVFEYHETAYPNFPLPRLVFAFHADTEGKISGCRMGVVADEKPTLDTVMYRYPFSNVGSSMGTICIGRNALPQYKTPHALASLPTFLLSIPNGDHSFNALNNKLNLQYRDLLEHLKDKEPSYYYSDVLIPNEKTLKDFIGG